MAFSLLDIIRREDKMSHEQRDLTVERPNIAFK